MKVGVLGGGQLARMLALAGLPLGVRCRFLDPSPRAVAGHIGELVVAPYDDVDGLRRLADGVDVVTFEVENVPASSIELLQRHVRVAPAPVALATRVHHCTAQLVLVRQAVLPAVTGHAQGRGGGGAGE